MGAADALLPLMYGDAPMETWRSADPAAGEPWTSFEQARRRSESGDAAGAEEIWQRIVQRDDLESRHILQAWHFLRNIGVEPSEGEAAAVLAAVAEVPIDDGHDVLAAYADGSVRYVNHSGSGSVVDPPAPPSLAGPATEWLAIAGRRSDQIGPWTGELPAVPAGHARVLMLTRSGPRFGQGPYDVMSADPAASAFLTAAVKVLVAVTDLGA